MNGLKLTTVAVVAILILPLSFTLLPDAPTSDLESGTLAIRSEKSKLMSSPQGHPDMYFEHFRDIRASESGEVEYPPGAVRHS